MTIVEILQTSRLEQRRLQKLMDSARIAAHGEAKHQVHIGRKDILPMIVLRRQQASYVQGKMSQDGVICCSLTV